MELKYAAELLQDLYDIRYQQCGNIPSYGKSHEAKALQIAISHLETLQKVKEASGVKRKEIYNKDNLCRKDCDKCEDTCWDYSNILRNKIHNEALDLKDAELAEKLGKIEGRLLKLSVVNEKMTCDEVKDLAKAIQELFLGKKEV